MPSITTWARLEPDAARADVASGYAAAVSDPLWFLARQWQVGEFQGSDGGTPIVARWRARVAAMTRYVPGPIPPETQMTAGPLAGDIPLQIRVEGQQLTQSATVAGLDGLRFAVDSGLHFLRLLGRQPTTANYADAFRGRYALAPLTDDQRAALDAETAGFAGLMAGRALDGRRLRLAFGNGADPTIDPGLHIATGDVAEVQSAARAWRKWVDALFSVPQDQTWQPDRLEYAFSLSTRLGDDQFGERTLTARSFDGDDLDWYSFDLNGDVNLGTAHDKPAPILTRTVVPAPVTYRGMPSTRFWEFEDPRLDLGSLTPGATDLAQLLLVETLTGFGNDWFLIPIDLPVGSLAETRSLVVTDTFGTRTLLRPTGDPAVQNSDGWSMFTLALPTSAADALGVAVTNLFYLPPSLVQPLDGPVLEEVSFARDELANMAWAIERRLESPLEVGVATSRSLDNAPPGAAAVTDPADAAPVYRIATTVPAHWIPLLPVRVDANSPEVRLARGAVLDLDGGAHVVSAAARLLDVGDPAGRLLIAEEEVPREGVVVQRRYRATRWSDGRLYVWAANRVTVGRGEESSGLAFDALQR
jgi:hypothetical protein